MHTEGVVSGRLVNALVCLPFPQPRETRHLVAAIRLPWQPLGALRSILYPIITCACRPVCGCNYLVCLRGNIEKAFIKLAQWVGIYGEVSGEAERLVIQWSTGTTQPAFIMLHGGEAHWISWVSLLVEKSLEVGKVFEMQHKLCMADLVESNAR